MVMSFFYHHGVVQANGVIRGEKWRSAGNDGMSKMISLYSTVYILMFCLVS